MRDGVLFRRPVGWVGLGLRVVRKNKRCSVDNAVKLRLAHIPAIPEMDPNFFPCCVYSFYFLIHVACICHIPSFPFDLHGCIRQKWTPPFKIPITYVFLETNMDQWPLSKIYYKTSTSSLNTNLTTKNIYMFLASNFTSLFYFFCQPCFTHQAQKNKADFFCKNLILHF